MVFVKNWAELQDSEKIELCRAEFEFMQSRLNLSFALIVVAWAGAAVSYWPELFVLKVVLAVCLLFFFFTAFKVMPAIQERNETIKKIRVKT